MRSLLMMGRATEQHTFEAARGVVGQKGQPLTLPSFLYAPFLHNAEVLAVTPIEPRMRALDKVRVSFLRQLSDRSSRCRNPRQ
jgi:hypothetical protein